MYTSVNLEDDGLTGDCHMSNKNTFSKYFRKYFLKEEKHWNTEQIPDKHCIFSKRQMFFPIKNLSFFPER